MSSERKSIKPTDVIIILVLLLTITAFIMFFSLYQNSNDSYAEISYNGNVVKTVLIKNVENSIFTLQENPNVGFEVKNAEIRFTNVNCPDKICESVGFISKSHEIAICMPNKVTLKIISNKNEIDKIV